MFSVLFHRLTSSVRRFTTVHIPGQGWDFIKSALHKDNIIITGAFGGMLVEGGLVAYKTFDSAKRLTVLEQKIESSAKENSKELKALDEKIESNAKENTKDLKDLERVFVSHFSNLQRDMIYILSSSSNRRPEEIVDALRREKQNETSSTTKEDKP
jgi:hypothetical protein